MRSHAVIPLPQSIDLVPGSTFVVSAQTVIIVPPGDERVLAIGRFLSDWIGLAAAPAPPRVEAAGQTTPVGSIVLTSSAPQPATRGTTCRLPPSG